MARGDFIQLLLDPKEARLIRSAIQFFLNNRTMMTEEEIDIAWKYISKISIELRRIDGT